ncbi:MAG: hypothetical protein E6R13_03825, partial [Spirochaetes bacterium]
MIIGNSNGWYYNNTNYCLTNIRSSYVTDDDWERLRNLVEGLYKVDTAGIVYKCGDTIVLQRSRSGQISFYDGYLSEEERICQYVKYNNKHY